jgi:hypothetical protein
MLVFPFEFYFNGQRHKARAWKIEPTSTHKTVEFHVHDIQPGFPNLPEIIMFTANAKTQMLEFANVPDTFLFMCGTLTGLRDYCFANNIPMLK